MTVADEARIELTIKLWGTGAVERFEEYVAALCDLLPRHRGELTRRVRPVDGGPGSPDTVLVMSFPDSVAIDGYLRDPLRADFEALGDAAIARSLITDGRQRSAADGDGTVTPIRPLSDQPVSNQPVSDP